VQNSAQQRVRTSTPNPCSTRKSAQILIAPSGAPASTRKVSHDERLRRWYAQGNLGNQRPVPLRWPAAVRRGSVSLSRYGSSATPNSKPPSEQHTRPASRGRHRLSTTPSRRFALWTSMRAAPMRRLSVLTPGNTRPLPSAPPERQTLKPLLRQGFQRVWAQVLDQVPETLLRLGSTIVTTWRT